MSKTTRSYNLDWFTMHACLHGTPGGTIRGYSCKLAVLTRDFDYRVHRRGAGGAGEGCVVGAGGAGGGFVALLSRNSGPNSVVLSKAALHLATHEPGGRHTMTVVQQGFELGPKRVDDGGQELGQTDDREPRCLPPPSRVVQHVAIGMARERSVTTRLLNESLPGPPRRRLKSSPPTRRTGSARCRPPPRGLVCAWRHRLSYRSPKPLTGRAGRSRPVPEPGGSACCY